MHWWALPSSRLLCLHSILQAAKVKSLFCIPHISDKGGLMAMNFTSGSEVSSSGRCNCKLKQMASVSTHPAAPLGPLQQEQWTLELGSFRISHSRHKSMNHLWSTNTFTSMHATVSMAKVVSQQHTKADLHRREQTEIMGTSSDNCRKVKVSQTSTADHSKSPTWHLKNTKYQANRF